MNLVKACTSSNVENQPDVGEDIRVISEPAQMSDDALNTEDESVDVHLI